MDNSWLDSVKWLLQDRRMEPEKAQTPSASLADRLVQIGLRLLEEHGMQGVTLRRIAAEAGVSHAAPAHHFDGLSGLLTAMATHAHRLFSDHIDKAAGKTDAFDALAAVCSGYLEFARRHAGLFQLMFVEEAVRRDDPAFQNASNRSYDILRNACLPFSTKGMSEEEIELSVWSLVHGFALLKLDGGCLPGGVMPGQDIFYRMLARTIGHKG